MANNGLPTYGLGSPSGLVIRGFGLEPTSPYILPDTGLTVGGDIFTIYNCSKSVAAYIDTFPGVSLNAGLWTAQTAGGGAVSVNNGLTLSTPAAAGGVASIFSNQAYSTFDVSASYAYNTSVEQYYPQSEIIFFRLSATIDASNMFMVEHLWDPSRGQELRVSVVVSGSTTILSSTTAKSAVRELRLLRAGGRIIAFAGSNILFDLVGWRTDPVSIYLTSKYATGSTLPTPLTTTVSAYTPKLVVTFDTEIAPYVSLHANRVVGRTPSMRLPTHAVVAVYDITSHSTLSTTFEFTAPPQLTVSRGGPTSIVVNNDPTLRD